MGVGDAFDDGQAEAGTQAEAKSALNGLFLGLGAVAGLIPALRAARLSPTQALWSV